MEAPAEDDDDDGLVRRVALGNRAAWGVLVDRHAGPLHGFSWRMLGDQTEAEDVVQEALMRLVNKAPAWQPGGARLRTWLYRVTFNLCVDRQRRKRLAPLSEAMELADPESGDRLPGRLDVAVKVRAAIAQLPPRQRAAIALVHYQGCSNLEAASALDISVDAVESLLARARRRLRAELAAVADDLLLESG